MNYERFKQIIEYSSRQREEMAHKVQDFYSTTGMSNEKGMMNLMQIVRPLFQTKGFLIIELPFKDCEIGAICYKGDALGYTFLNSSLPKVNMNFALCHEIYHVIYQKSEFMQKAELMNEHYYEYEEEFAANLFAGMLLMPEQSFSTMFRKFSQENTNKESDLPVLAQLMSYYEAPYMAVLIRSYELNLLRAGSTLKKLIAVDSNQVHSEFQNQWLNQRILEATGKDDFENFETVVKRFGEEYLKEGYINERTLRKSLENMRVLYHTIKGD